MLRINLRKSLPQNTTLSKRLAWCRRERKVKFLVLAVELYQPHDVSASSLVYLRIAFSVRYFSGRTCYLFFFVLFQAVATAHLQFWDVNLLCDMEFPYSSYPI